jgi:hypothetical protein
MRWSESCVVVAAVLEQPRTVSDLPHPPYAISFHHIPNPQNPTPDWILTDNRHGTLNMIKLLSVHWCIWRGRFSSRHNVQHTRTFIIFFGNFNNINYYKPTHAHLLILTCSGNGSYMFRANIGLIFRESYSHNYTHYHNIVTEVGHSLWYTWCIDKMSLKLFFLEWWIKFRTTHLLNELLSIVLRRTVSVTFYLYIRCIIDCAQLVTMLW